MKGAGSRFYVSSHPPPPDRPPVKEAAVAVKEAPALGIIAPDEADYPSFDRSGLTDDAIRIVQEHVARHNNLDLKSRRPLATPGVASPPSNGTAWFS